MRAYGAEIVTVTREEGMEGARDLAQQMADEGRGRVLDQFANPDNPLAHYRTTAPEIWEGTDGAITHFVCSMGTTGTIMGASKYFRERNPDIQIIGLQPADGAAIPGIRRWPEAYLPRILMPQPWTGPWRWASRKPRTPCGPWPPRRASSAVFPPAAVLPAHYGFPGRLKMPSSSPLSATGVIGIFQPVCSPRHKSHPHHV